MKKWTQVCHLKDLIPDSGLAALVNGQQIALFYIDDVVYAVDNYDPIGKAYVMSRGFCGDLNGELFCASPLQKEHYSLHTGQCLDKEGISIPVYETKIENDMVYVNI